MGYVTLSESIKIFKNIEKRVSKDTKSSENIEALKNKDCFKKTHYNAIFGPLMGILKTSVLESMGFQGLNIECDDQNCFERCSSLVNDMLVGVEAWKKFWIPGKEKRLLHQVEIDRGASGIHDGSIKVYMLGIEWPSSARNAAHPEFRVNDTDHITWGMAYDGAMTAVGGYLKKVKKALGNLR